jgi:hypothetical protein
MICGVLVSILSMAVSIVTSGIYENLHNIRLNFVSVDVSPSIFIFHISEIR